MREFSVSVILWIGIPVDTSQTIYSPKYIAEYTYYKKVA